MGGYKGYGLEYSYLDELPVSEVRLMSLSRVHATIVSLIPKCVLILCYRCRNLGDLCSDLVPKITCRCSSPALSSASGFEHPASTLPTRFPAALGIGHGSACGLANAPH